eukprot:6208409-Pleurochrysis_carterae.AAC.3
MSISHTTVGATRKAIISFCSVNDHQTRVRQRCSLMNLTPKAAPKSGTNRFCERSLKIFLWISSPKWSSRSKSTSSVSTSSATWWSSGGIRVQNSANPCLSTSSSFLLTTHAALTSTWNVLIRGSFCNPLPDVRNRSAMPAPTHRAHVSSINPMCRPNDGRAHSRLVYAWCGTRGAIKQED